MIHAAERLALCLFIFPVHYSHHLQHEICETHDVINMEFIKEESEEIRIPDPCRVKDEDTEMKIGGFRSN